jgi:phospholipid-binding lipoprotein MlaA
MYIKTKKNKVLKGSAVFCCVTVLLLAGCATTGTVQSSDIDPYEDFNRSVFSFNKLLDDYVADPIVQAYTWVTPRFVQTGIGNFFSNLKDINVVLNDLMQAKFMQGGEDTGRFLVNTTIGLGGLFDIASEFGLSKHDEDFDQTFAVWGIPQGPYLVLPVLGPTTGRGITGGILDAAANPTSYVGAPVQLLNMLNARANAEGSLKLIDEAALDPYVFTRESYLQFRKHLITDGKSEITDDVLNVDDVVAEGKEPKKAAPVVTKTPVKMEVKENKPAVGGKK